MASSSSSSSGRSLQQQEQHSDSDQSASKKVRFDWSSTQVSGGKKKMPEQKRKSAIHYILKDYKDTDTEWLREQSRRNNDSINSALVTFPSWQIVSQKWIRLQYQWSTGETAVIMEHVNSNKQDTTFTGIRMTRAQWDTLVELMPMIQEYIEFAEKGESWQALALMKGHQLTEATQGGGRGAQIRIRAFDMTFITITSLDEWYQDGCHVDVREFVWDKTNAAKLIPIRHGLTLVGGGFDFLARFLVPKVNAGLRMYTEIHKHGSSFLQMCYQKIEEAKQEEEVEEEEDEAGHEEEDGALLPAENRVTWSISSPEPSQYSKFY